MQVSKLRSDWLNGAIVDQLMKSPDGQRYLLDLQEDLRNIKREIEELNKQVNPTP